MKLLECRWIDRLMSLVSRNFMFDLKSTEHARKARGKGLSYKLPPFDAF
ncbi:hypothetical protein F442_18813 [Phytophthora nicotianae P10297]|uniref:Uncharacterized protein n=2 Tax=Phytophthora nicotianae TaxID=4792 RepID=W2YE48_PHYNI|nr:hypothetical protein F444_18984 [Phytophthora nicotianae P1976]ETP32479.1 hypothetical protein F442_18813 [Phytophthora nicotianae P10297]